MDSCPNIFGVRFDQAMLERLGQGERAALVQGGGNRLDGLCLARAYLDSRGEPERSERRMSLVYAISAAQIDTRRGREAHEQDGQDWGL